MAIGKKASHSHGPISGCGGSGLVGVDTSVDLAQPVGVVNLVPPVSVVDLAW